MRRKLSDLVAPGSYTPLVISRRVVEGSDMIVFKHSHGGFAFMVSPDDMFDAAGNRFENDLEIA